MSIPTAVPNAKTPSSLAGMLNPSATGARAVTSVSHLVVLAVLLATSLVLRLPFLGSMSLWLDEIWSIGTSRMPWRSVLWVITHQDSNASLYYALLHAWMRLGSGEAAVRSLSVLLGVATLPVLYMLGNRLLGKPAGFIASLLLAVNQFHIAASQEARSYSLLVLLITISTLLFVRCIERPLGRNWLGYVLASVLAIYAHVFAVLVLASHLASVLFLRRQEVPWKKLLASTAMIGALASPVGILILNRMQEPSAPLAWVHKPTFGTVCRVFWSLSGGTFGLRSALVVGMLLTTSYFVVCLIALLDGMKVWRASGRSFAAWRLGLPFSCLMIPITLSLAVSFVKPVFVDRYLIICLPALTLMAAKGIQSIKPRWSAVAVAASIASLAIVATVPYYQFRSHNREWKTATGYILEQAQPGDAIIFFVAPGRLLFDYYRRGEYRGSDATLNVLYPEFGDENRDPNVLTYLPPLDSSLLDRAASRYQRVWLVLFHDEFAFTNPVSQRIQGSLSAHYRKIQESRFEGNHERVVLLLYAIDDADQKPNNQTAAGGGLPAR